MNVENGIEKLETKKPGTCQTQEWEAKVIFNRTSFNLQV